jgi:hypothetical protein
MSVKETHTAFGHATLRPVPEPPSPALPELPALVSKPDTTDTPLSPAELAVLHQLTIAEITSNTEMSAEDAVAALELANSQGKLKVLQYRDYVLVIFDTDELLVKVPRSSLTRVAKAPWN